MISIPSMCWTLCCIAEMVTPNRPCVKFSRYGYLQSLLCSIIKSSFFFDMGYAWRWVRRWICLLGVLWFLCMWLFNIRILFDDMSKRNYVSWTATRCFLDMHKIWNQSCVCKFLERVFVIIWRLNLIGLYSWASFWCVVDWDGQGMERVLWNVN